MKRNYAVTGMCFVSIGLAVIVGAAWAGFQAKAQIGKLSLNGWQLQAKDGQLGLAQIDSGKWYASAPTITNESGLFISADPAGKTPGLHLVKGKGPHVQWAFEFTERWKPGEATREEVGISNAGLLVGDSGFSFKMKLAEGPFKDWYVAVDPLPPEAKDDPAKVPAWRPLKLVQDPQAAAEFDYRDTHYEVGHK